MKLWQKYFASRETFLAWTAGFFDGEGTVFVGAQRCGDYLGYSLSCGIHQLLPAPLELIASEFGGDVRIVHPKRAVGYKTVRPIATWKRSGDQALKFLAAIQPYAINKRDEIDVALEYPPQQKGAKKGHKGLLKTPPEVNAKRLLIREQLFELKARKKPPEILGVLQ